MSKYKYSLLIPILLFSILIAAIISIVGNAIVFADSKELVLDSDELYISPLNLETKTTSIKINVDSSFGLIDKNSIFHIGLLDNYASEDLWSEFISLNPNNESIIAMETINAEEQVVFPIDNPDEPVYLFIANPNKDKLILDITIYYQTSGIDNTFSFVARVIIASVIIVICTLTIAIFIFEYLQPSNHRTILYNTDLDDRIEGYISQLETWQVFLVGVSYFLIPIGIGNILLLEATGVSNDGSQLVTASILIAIVHLTNKSKNRTRSVIISALENTGTVSITDLSNMTGIEFKKLKKEVINLMLSKNSSISFDYLTNLVSIKNPKQSKNANTRIITETGDQIVDIKSESEIVQSPISRECAYCGEKAVVAQAQFCIGCGASLSSAK